MKKMSERRKLRMSKMLSLAKKYEEGTQTQRIFCEENGIRQSTLNYWLSKYRKKGSPKSVSRQIIPIQVKKEPAGVIRIVTSQGVQIEIPT